MGTREWPRTRRYGAAVRMDKAATAPGRSSWSLRRACEGYIRPTVERRCYVFTLNRAPLIEALGFGNAGLSMVLARNLAELL